MPEIILAAVKANHETDPIPDNSFPNQMTIHSSYKLKNTAKSSSSPKYATTTDSKSGIQESTVKTVTGQHPFMKRSEAHAC
jgi:hypothetical protein